MSLNRISRRDALLALGVAGMRQARADGGLLRATRVDHVALAVWNIDATSAPVFEIVIATFGPLGRLVSQPERREVEPHANAPLPMRTKNVQPFCM